MSCPQHSKDDVADDALTSTDGGRLVIQPVPLVDGEYAASTAPAVDYCEHTFVNTVACAWCGVRQGDIPKAGDHE